jgi:hypothetical protein
MKQLYLSAKLHRQRGQSWPADKFPPLRPDRNL